MPAHIGKFAVLSEIGRGGMGIVYKVRDPKTQQVAALKMIPPDALARPDSALRFKREFRAMQRVEHPNVIRVFEAGTSDGCPFFTMEYIEGKDIREWLDGEEPIVPSGKDPPPAATLSTEQRRRLNDPVRTKKLADAVVQVAYALSEIHSHRIVHRDLKPDNIMVSKAGLVKLMDFGIAKQMSANAEHSSSGGMVVGTFKYLSPEQALGADIDGRADLYCLGIILYELLAGRHPFYSENSVGYAYHHARKPPPDIAKFNPEVHKGLKAVTEKLIKKDPRERYPTADDVVAAIREAMEGFVDEQSARLKLPPKGKELPFELAKDQLFQPALVGRVAEERALVQAAEQLLAGRGAVVAVTGKKGIGKTRLVREVAGTFRGRSIDFVWGSCPASGGLPYQPYLDILDTLVGELDKLDPDEARRMLGADGPVLARYIGALERLSGDARPRPAPPLEPQGEKLRFHAAVASFLSRCTAHKTRTLVIDDLHHADELSLSLTRHLVETLARNDGGDGPSQRYAPIALVFTLDPGSADRSAGDTAGENARALLSRLSQHGLVSLPLPALSPAEVQEMLASMIGGGEVAQALADYLHHETDGVPGLVEERVRAWAESGELRRKGRQWVLIKAPKQASSGKRAVAPAVGASSGAAAAAPGANKDGDLEKPTNLEQVVELRSATRADIPVPDLESPSDKRISRLSGVARDVAERMAVAGERVPGSLLERIALRSEDELLDALDELLKRSILQEDKSESFFRFQDADDRAALLTRLPAERKQHLHLLVARAIDEDARRNKRAVSPEDQAKHFLEGHDVLRAIEQLMLAARLSLQASATQSAAQRVREAQELLAKEAKRQPGDAALERADLELVLLRLDVLAAVNEHKDCVDLAQRRLKKFRSGHETRLLSETLLRLAASERVLGDLDAALDHVGEVLSTTERGGAHGLRCRAKSLCGQIYEQRGEFELSLRYYSDALELARAIGDELEEERARSAIATRRLVVGDLDSAKADFDRLLKQAEARGEKLRILNYINSLGIIAHEAARYDEAEICYRRMAELAKPAGDRKSVATAQANIGVIRRDQGRFDDAFALFGKCANILGQLNQRESLSYTRIIEAQTFLDRGADGDAQQALDKAEEAFDLADKVGAALKLAEAGIARGQAQVRLGRVDRGVADIERGLEAARVVGANRIALFGLLALCEARHARGDVDGARAVLREAQARVESTGFLRFRSRIKKLADRL